jgi:hypothetical protein
MKFGIIYFMEYTQEQIQEALKNSPEVIKDVLEET